MKNTGKKILILGIVFAAAIAGIFAFYQPIVNPPTKVSVHNPHKSAIEASINKFSDLGNTDFNDSVYDEVVDKLAIYKSEGFITEEEAEHQTKSLVQRYVPIFINLSNQKFDNKIWHESDHKAMRNRIKHLRTLKVDYGLVSAVAYYETALQKIEQIINDYENAKNVANYSTFDSIENAKKKIKDAKKYMEKKPLSNCENLIKQLARVRVNIGNSHYSQVEQKVNEMANYRNMTEEAFESLASTADGKIEEYEKHREEMYGNNSKTVTAINQKAINYYNEAKEFFRKRIEIYTDNQWVSIQTPHPSYKAYQSSSNHNIDNSEATMSFTIKGYDSFTFYVRNDGEINYDFVMVGVDKKPERSSKDAITFKKAKSETSFDAYEQVTLNNLTKSDTHTIYVTYTKDFNVNGGETDRGYVLIPYEDNY